MRCSIGQRLEQTHRPWRCRVLAARQHAAQDIVLDEDLDGLRHPRREHAAALHGREIVARCTVPARSGAARRLAAATASCIARLMPTPPTGDIACAASPMHSRPGRCHCARRSTLTVSSLTSSQVSQLLHAIAHQRRDRDDRVAKRVEPLRLDLVGRALADHIGALPIVAAVDHHEHPPGGDAAERLGAVALPPRQPHPQHVHRRADVLDREAGALAHHRGAAVGPDHERRCGPRARRRASSRARRRCGRPPRSGR